MAYSILKSQFDGSDVRHPGKSHGKMFSNAFPPKRITEFGLNDGHLCLLDPKPYVEFLGLQPHATVVIADSGGIQEETTYLGIPCLTMRENTERPITVSMGTNVLVGNDPKKLRAEFSRVLRDKSKTGSLPPLWDGRTGDRNAEILLPQTKHRPSGVARA